jgi:UDP-glucose 4-epimerase
MTILVTGARGWLGRVVCGQLQRQGHRVLALDVGGREPGPWVQYVSGDISTDGIFGDAIIRALADTDSVIHCAGYAHRPRETPLEVARFWSINRDGSRRVLELARQIGAQRFVYLSSIAFYDWSLAGPRGEEDPLLAPTAYAGSKLAGERYCVESRLDWRVARLGTVYGAGDRANFAKLAQAQGRRRFVLPGRGSARKSVLPLDLAAELLVDLAVRPTVPHRLVNLALPEPPSLREICAGFASTCGLPMPWSLPEAWLRLLARLGDRMEQRRPGFPLTTLNLHKLTTSTVVDTRRMQENWPGRRWGSFQDWLAPAAGYYRQLVESRGKQGGGSAV